MRHRSCVVGAPELPEITASTRGDERRPHVSAYEGAPYPGPLPPVVCIDSRDEWRFRRKRTMGDVGFRRRHLGLILASFLAFLSTTSQAAMQTVALSTNTSRCGNTTLEALGAATDLSGTLKDSQLPKKSAESLRIRRLQDDDPTPAPVPSPVSSPTPKPIDPPTKVPTPNPSPKSSSAPTEKPVSDPTSKPTEHPHPSPTRKPTPKPNPSPTSSPSERSNPSPTLKPIADPTTSPTPQPVEDPTESPVGAPTDAPAAQASVTELPTLTPVGSPTVEPIGSPTVAPVGSPSVAPIISPTVAPIDSPTTSPSVGPINPTIAPVDNPTSSPTSHPSVLPVFPDPTSAPSLSPVSAPTSLPVNAPTITPAMDDPTSAPSQAPVLPASPTQTPQTSTPTATPATESPSVAPVTESPTPAPVTPAPSRGPTTAPSLRPTQAPVRNPSGGPTVSPTTSPPTQSPTLSPTESPTNSPTEGPTTFPTRRPTPRPTRRPTLRPTFAPGAPTPEPTTGMPSSSPSTSFPTRSPTFVPTTSPSSGPTFSPSLQPTRERTMSGVQPSAATENPTAAIIIGDGIFENELQRIGLTAAKMIVQFTLRRNLQSGAEEAALCVNVWRDYVQSRIRNEVLEVTPLVEMVDVELQNVMMDRQLDAEALVFLFDMEIQIRTPATDLTANQYLEGPFDSPEEKQALIDFLRTTSCPEFAYASAVELVLPVAPDTGSPGGNSGANTGLIVGIVAAVLAAAMLVALYVFVKMKGRKAFRYDENLRLSDVEDAGTNEYASEIGVRTANDVSTLSDPIPLGLTAAPGETSTIGSLSLDYDYQKAYQASVSEFSGSHPDSLTNALVSTDDDTLDAQYVMTEQFHVIAPAGVLGLILETNEDGVPVVNSIKSSSVLFGQVQVGDRLLSVDGQDVTVLLASDVSKLIASKKHKPERRLVFGRSIKMRGQTGVIDVDA